VNRAERGGERNVGQTVCIRDHVLNSTHPADGVLLDWVTVPRTLSGLASGESSEVIVEEPELHAVEERAKPPQPPIREARS
jgi:hypothetical protein